MARLSLDAIRRHPFVAGLVLLFFWLADKLLDWVVLTILRLNVEKWAEEQDVDRMLSDGAPEGIMQNIAYAYYEYVSPAFWPFVLGLATCAILVGIYDQFYAVRLRRRLSTDEGDEVLALVPSSTNALPVRHGLSTDEQETVYKIEYVYKSELLPTFITLDDFMHQQRRVVLDSINYGSGRERLSEAILLYLLWRRQDAVRHLDELIAEQRGSLCDWSDALARILEEYCRRYKIAVSLGRIVENAAMTPEIANASKELYAKLHSFVAEPKARVVYRRLERILRDWQEDLR